MQILSGPVIEEDLPLPRCGIRASALSSSLIKIWHWFHCLYSLSLSLSLFLPPSPPHPPSLTPSSSISLPPHPPSLCLPLSSSLSHPPSLCLSPILHLSAGVDVCV